MSTTTRHSLRCAGVLLLLAAACGPKNAPPRPSPRLANPDVEAEVSVVIEALVTGDPVGRVTDSLFSPTASVATDGMTRFSAPRLAGVAIGGMAAVTGSEVNVRQDVAWALFDYRWFSADKRQVRQGKAMAVLTPKKAGNGWLIVALESAAGK